MSEEQWSLAEAAEQRMARYSNDHYREHRAALAARHPELERIAR
jgi:hypothetical protein